MNRASSFGISGDGYKAMSPLRNCSRAETALRPGRTTGKHRLFCTLPVLLVLGPFVAFCAARSQDGDGWRDATVSCRPFLDPDLLRPREARRILEQPSSDAQHTSRTGDDAATDVTPEISLLAYALHGSPQLLYEHVRNTIDYLPVFGSLKGAHMTLIDRRGGDFDQASLLIALLRHSGYNARYVYGLIELDGERACDWLGVSTAAAAESLLANGGIPASVYADAEGNLARLEVAHVWVEAEIAGGTCAFDPSLKAYSRTEGVDLAAASGYSRNAFLNQATDGMTTTPNYVQGVNRRNIRTALTDLTANLVDYIRQNAPSPGLADIAGQREIVAVRDESFRTVHPHEIQRYATWTAIPPDYQSSLRIQHLGIDITLPSAEIYGKRFTIIYDDADRPLLILDGEAVAHGNAGTAWTSEPVLLFVDHPFAEGGGTYADEDGVAHARVGGVYQIANGWGGTGQAIIAYHQDMLARFVDMGAGEGSEALLGEGLAVIVSTWLAEVTAVYAMTDSVGGTVTTPLHDIGLVGTSTAPFMDMPLSRVGVTAPGSDTARAYAVLHTQTGLASALEWGALDQLQEPTAVSTVKALDVANAAGYKLFEVTSANYETGIRPQLVGYTAGMLAVAESYLNSGYRLLLPEHGNLWIGDWHGHGFIAIGAGDKSMTNMITGALLGGFVVRWGPIDIDDVREQRRRENLDRPPKSSEPVDLATGYYRFDETDLTVGTGRPPLGLLFTRSYFSGAAGREGPMGFGWRHNWDISLKCGSDGLLGLGRGSAIDAAAQLVEMLVSIDLLTDGLSKERLSVVTVAHAWFMENLVDNVVTVDQPGQSRRFSRLPDDTYAPSPVSPVSLTENADGSFELSDQYRNAMHFTPSGRLERITDRNDNSTMLHYADDRLQTVSNDVHTLSLVYNEAQRLSFVRDEAGRSISFGYDTEGNLISVRDPGQNETRFEYGDRHCLERVYNALTPAAPVIENAYDDWGRVLSQTDVENHTYDYYVTGSRTEERRPDGTSRVYYFDRAARMVLDIKADDTATTVGYDAAGRMTRVTLPEGNAVEYTYDRRGIPTTVRYLPKPGSNDVPVSETYRHDPTFGGVVEYIDPAGYATNFEYDDRGNLLRVLLPEVQGNRATIEFTHNDRGQILTVKAPDGAVKSQSYDAVTRELQSVTVDRDGLALTTHYEYDDVGNVTAITDPRGNRRQYSYDANRMLVTSVSPPPFEYITRFEYDANGYRTRVTRQANAEATEWNTVEEIRAADGVLTGRVDALGRMTVRNHDKCRRLWRVTDPMQRTHEFLYDACGRPYRQFNALNQRTRLHAYTPNGLSAVLTDAAGHRLRYRYDGFDRGVETTFEDESRETVQYDVNGNLECEQSRSGTQISYEYDSRGRLEVKQLSSQNRIEYSYDDVNRLKSASDNDGAVTFSYDGAGRVTATVDQRNRVLSFGYDRVGNRVRITYPDGNLVRYEYDAMNRLTAVKHGNGTLIAAFAYDPLDREIRRDYANGVYVVRDYDARNDVIRIENAFRDSNVTFDYAFNPAGGLHAESVDDPAFRYRLEPGRSEYTANDLNQIFPVNSAACTYDLDGNLAEMNGGAYVWDNLNRLVRCETGTTTATYAYDPFGRRKRKTVDGVTTTYVYDDERLVAEYDGGTLAVRYVYAPGVPTPILIEVSGDSCYVHTDRLGSIIALSDENGALAESHGYSAYGLQSGERFVSQSLGYLGMAQDSESGLVHFRARYYAPFLGRFLSPDPIGDAGGDLNLYRYCRNDPLNHVDRSGLQMEGYGPSMPEGPFGPSYLPGIGFLLKEILTRAGYEEAGFVVGNVANIVTPVVAFFTCQFHVAVTSYPAALVSTWVMASRYHYKRVPWAYAIAMPQAYSMFNAVEKAYAYTPNNFGPRARKHLERRRREAELARQRERERFEKEAAWREQQRNRYRQTSAYRAGRY